MTWRNFINTTFIAAMAHLFISMASYIAATLYPSEVVAHHVKFNMVASKEGIAASGMFVGYFLFTFIAFLVSVSTLVAFKSRELAITRESAIHVARWSFILTVIFGIGTLYWA